MRALRWTFSKLKPPDGALVSRPMSGLVNSDMVVDYYCRINATKMTAYLVAR